MRHQQVSIQRANHVPSTSSNAPAASKMVTSVSGSDKFKEADMLSVKMHSALSAGNLTCRIYTQDNRVHQRQVMVMR